MVIRISDRVLASLEFAPGFVNLLGRFTNYANNEFIATEVWTFVRPKGSNWELSAIQQA